MYDILVTPCVKGLKFDVYVFVHEIKTGIYTRQLFYSFIQFIYAKTLTRQNPIFMYISRYAVFGIVTKIYMIIVLNKFSQKLTMTTRDTHSPQLRIKKSQ